MNCLKSFTKYIAIVAFGVVCAAAWNGSAARVEASTKAQAMNIQRNFALKIFLKVASNVAHSDTDIGHHWAPGRNQFLRRAICVTMSPNAARELMAQPASFPRRVS